MQLLIIPKSDDWMVYEKELQVLCVREAANALEKNLEVKLLNLACFFFSNGVP